MKNVLLIPCIVIVQSSESDVQAGSDVRTGASVGWTSAYGDNWDRIFNSDSEPVTEVSPVSPVPLRELN